MFQRNPIESGQISIIPRPECFGDFGGIHLQSPPFWAEVAIICPDRMVRITLQSIEFLGHLEEGPLTLPLFWGTKTITMVVKHVSVTFFG